MSKLLIMRVFTFILLMTPFFLNSQSFVDSVYEFNVGDEFHYTHQHRTNSGTNTTKTIKKIIGKTYTSGPGMIATDKVAPCNSSSHFHYNSTYSDPTIGLYICKFTDTIITRNDYGPTYVRYYYSSNKYSIIDNFSTGLGKSLRIEKYSDSAGYYTVTEKLVYYKKDSINKTWGTPVAFNIGLDELNTLDFSVYPNPASNFINVSGIDNNKTEYEVLNSLGKLVVSGSLNSQKIDCSTLSNGIYFLKLIDSDNNRGVKRIVVAR
jgi:hypothetical protein